MKGYEMELDTKIETIHKHRHVNVDLYDGYVWLGLVTESARCHVRLNTEQAKNMIAALIRIVDSGDSK